MQIKLKVDGMTCGGCVRAVQNVLTGMDKVQDVSIDLPTGEVLVTVSAGLEAAELVGAVERAGYEARPL